MAPNRLTRGFLGVSGQDFAVRARREPECSRGGRMHHGLPGGLYASPGFCVNLDPDAHLAAVLRGHGVATLYMHDRDFRRFDFLTVHGPLDGHDAPRGCPSA